MTFTLTRREFVRRLSVVTAVAPLVRHRARAPIVLRIGVVPGDSRHALPARARQQGVAMGVDEAKRAATLFGGAVETRTTTATALRSQHLSAVLGGDDAASCGALARAAGDAGVLYVNTACSSDALRSECRELAYHVIPSDAMYRDALSLARTSGHSVAGNALTAVAWDPSFVRFGADSLNERYRSHYGTGMTAEAWGAWFAVKILWESALRARSGTPSAIASFLARDTTQFDGYKGRPLSFRAWDHQLRQPVYVMARGAAGAMTLVAEEPVAHSSDEASREVLDRIGTSAAGSPCHLGK